MRPNKEGAVGMHCRRQLRGGVHPCPPRFTRKRGLYYLWGEGVPRQLPPTPILILVIVIPLLA